MNTRTLKFTCLPLLIASAASAASLTNTANTLVVSTGGSEVAGSYLVSVFDGSASYSSADSSVSGTLGDGTLEDYAFYNFASGNINTYAEGSASIIGAASVDDSLDPGGDALSGNSSVMSVWETTDPSGFTSTADYTVSTMVKPGNVSGSLDVSSFTSGTVYFFYGTFADANSVTVTMSGVGQTDVVTGTGDQNVGGQNAFYVSAFSFTTDGLYDTLIFDYLNVDADGSRARFGGVVVDAVVPEPGTYAMIAGVLALSFVALRRRTS